MENKLEQSLIYAPRVSEERQIIYQVGDLESLSSVALYTKVKRTDYTKGNEEEINFYNYLNLPLFGQTGIYFQEEGKKSHKKLAKRAKSQDPDITIFPSGGFRIGGGIGGGY